MTEQSQSTTLEQETETNDNSVSTVRAYEEGLIRPDKVFQVGLRGTGYAATDFTEAPGGGFRIFQAHEGWGKPLDSLGAEIRAEIGDLPVYITYDIDSLDPAFAPGTGTVEVGGLTTVQGLEIIRGCAGLNLVGGDLVEVSPPYDSGGNTAVIAANYLYEMLCALPGVPQTRGNVKPQIDF